MSVRIVLIDDHALIRRGLRETLSAEPGLEVVGEAGSYEEWRELARQVSCDLLVLDVSLPGRSGIEILESLAEEAQPPRVIMLSQYPEDQYGVRALKSGAMAYLNKSAEPAQIVAAVRTVAAGKRFLTPEIAQALATSVVERHVDAPHQSLSEREMQTMLAIASGKRLSEIAAALRLSPKTVSVYRSRVMEKLSVGGNAEIAAYALRNRLME